MSIFLYRNTLSTARVFQYLSIERYEKGREKHI